MSLGLFEKIRKKQSLAERERLDEGENVAYEKEQALQTGEEAVCKRGRNIL